MWLQKWNNVGYQTKQKQMNKFKNKIKIDRIKNEQQPQKIMKRLKIKSK